MMYLKQFLQVKFQQQRIDMNSLFGNKKIELYSTVFIFIILGLIVIGIIWSSFATLDKITRGSGKVIPSSQLQIIQNLEGGILAELFIEEGDIVNKGDILLRIDDTNFSSTLRENRARRDSLTAQLRRLEAEVTENENISTVFLNGEIDMDIADNVREVIFPLIDAGKEVHLNLKDVQYMDSSGISVLVESNQRAKEKNTKVELKEVSQPVEKVLAMARKFL